MESNHHGSYPTRSLGEWWPAEAQETRAIEGSPDAVEGVSRAHSGHRVPSPAYGLGTRRTPHAIARESGAVSVWCPEADR